MSLCDASAAWVRLSALTEADLKWHILASESPPRRDPDGMERVCVTLMHVDNDSSPGHQPKSQRFHRP